MIENMGSLKGVADKQKWAARGASFVAKVKATKLIWFPPKIAETGKATASTAKKTTENPTKKTAGAAKKTAGAAKKTAGAAKKTAGPAKKTASSTRKVTKPAPPKDT